MRVLQWETRLLTLFMLHLDLSESKKNPSQSQTTEDSQITFSNQNPQYQAYYPPQISSSNVKKTKDKKGIDNLVKLYGKKRLKGQDVITNERSEEMEDYIGKYTWKFDFSAENDKNLVKTTTEKVNETTEADKSEVNQGLLQFVSLIFSNLFEATISKMFSIIESSL